MLACYLAATEQKWQQALTFELVGFDLSIGLKPLESCVPNLCIYLFIYLSIYYLLYPFIYLSLSTYSYTHHSIIKSLYKHMIAFRQEYASLKQQTGIMNSEHLTKDFKAKMAWGQTAGACNCWFLASRWCCWIFRLMQEMNRNGEETDKHGPIYIIVIYHHHHTI